VKRGGGWRTGKGGRQLKNKKEKKWLKYKKGER
jgi:hypothetical protein